MAVVPSEAQGVEVDFQTVPELQQFVIPNVRPTGRELGRGSYGAVEEVEIPGATCAAKIIHEALLRFGSEDEVRNITEKFVRECCLMSSLRHPHVVQFFGVCFLPGSRLPALVMEKLLVSLHDLLETNPNIPLSTNPNIPLSTKCSILHDVARGLLYLHSRTPPIIHHDLTAKNVLLNSAMVAKLADLGVARIVESRPGQIATQLTQAPGTAVYMPPEALEPEGTYDTKLDIFSFGNVALFTLTQVFPAPLKYPNYIDPTTRRCVARSEIERRFHYIQQMHEALGQEHILVRIIEQCLQDLPEDRPSIEEVVQQLEDSSAQLPSRCGKMTKLELEQENELLRLENADLQQRIQLTPQQSQTSSELEIATGIQLTPQPSQTASEPKQLNLKWRRGRDAYFSLGSTIQTAVLDGNVCVKAEDEDSSFVMVYDTEEDKWNMLCRRSVGKKECAMVLNDGQLVLAGGDLDKTAQNIVAVWNVNSKRWQYPYSPMPTPRGRVLSVRHQQYLIFVGGVTRNPYAATRNVEILDTSRSQWFIAESLPEPCRLKQCVTVGDTLYVLESRSFSGQQLIFECSVPTLISLATSESTATVPTWKKFPDTQLRFYSLVTYRNLLLAVGGLGSQTISGIYAYKSDTSEWSKIGSLPTALKVTLFVVLPSNEFYVLGGRKVYIGTPDSV